MPTAKDQNLRRQSFVERFVLARAPFFRPAYYGVDGEQALNCGIELFNKIVATLPEDN